MGNFLFYTAKVAAALVVAQQVDVRQCPAGSKQISAIPYIII